MMSYFIRVSTCLLGMLSLTFLLGCSSSIPPSTDSGDIEKLTQISDAYRKANLKLGRPPKSRDELKPYFPKTTDLDKLFTSNNDGQPYVILWGIVTDPYKLNFGVRGQPEVIAFEKEGKDGYRIVATAMRVQLMDQEQFAQANLPEGKRP